MTAKTLSSLIMLAFVVLVLMPAAAQTELAMLMTTREDVVLREPAVSVALEANYQALTILQVKVPIIDSDYRHSVTMVPPTHPREAAALAALEYHLSYPVNGTRTLSERAFDPLPKSFRILLSLFMPGVK